MDGTRGSLEKTRKVQQEYGAGFAEQFERKLVGEMAYTAHTELASDVAAAEAPVAATGAPQQLPGTP